MTIPEAIKDLTDMKKVLRTILPPHEQKSLDLAIEALKEIKRARVVSLFPDNHQLPGETEE